MSTKAIREVLEFWAESCPEAPAGIKAKAALAELEAIEKAATDVTRLNMGDFTYNIRDRAAGDATFDGNTWHHPDVKAWSDASMLFDAIAKERSS